MISSVALFGLAACANDPLKPRICTVESGPEIAILPPSVGPAGIHRTEVTQSHFADFVAQSGYVSLAERDDPEEPGVRLGSAVFQTPTLSAPGWWRLDRTASWRRPTGTDEPAPDGLPRSDQPAVQIAYEDALAYAEWAGGRVPTLEEWRTAALAGEAWDHLTAPPETANTWQGTFPLRNAVADGFAERAPVGRFPPNAYGLHDMVGNAWEWTATPAGPDHGILAGGSFLCDVDFCRNGTPFGEQVQELDFSASHIGFRLVFDALPEACDA
ncbi:MAG: SUMF1/EgtB/PvdO family nonheme iron enzyme [Litorimonas sp.]